MNVVDSLKFPALLNKSVFGNLKYFEWISTTTSIDVYKNNAVENELDSNRGKSRKKNDPIASE